MSLPETATLLLHHYGYVFIFLVSIVEGPIITMAGAFLAARGYFNIGLVYMAVVIGDLVGDIAYYTIGRLSRTATLETWWLVFGMTPGRFERLEDYFRKYGAGAMFYAKFTQTGIIALPAAGAARMPIGAFLWYNMLGTLLKSLILILLGYFFGYAYSQIDSYFVRGALIVFLLGCIAGLYVFTWQNRRLDA